MNCVGVTRAIDNLYLFSPRNRKGQFKDISRFIVEGKLNDMPVDAYGYGVGSKVVHRTYGIAEIVQFDEKDKDKIKLKFRDGTFRSFSLKVLIDNGLIRYKFRECFEVENISSFYYVRCVSKLRE